MFALLATAQVKTFMDGKSEVTLHRYIAPTTHALKSYEAAQTAVNKATGTYVSPSLPPSCPRIIRESASLSGIKTHRIIMRW